MTTPAEWAAGQPCQRHELAFCADCRDLAKITRLSDGSLHYKADCAVQTFCEIAGATYDEAAAIMTEAGFRPGAGTASADVCAAFEQAGYKVTPMTGMKIDTLTYLSAAGRVFYVSGVKNRKGHAWSIINGQATRAFAPPFRYRAYEVTA